MPAKNIYLVQQFDRVGKKLVAGRQMELKTAVEAVGRADRDAARCAGVVAITQTIDTEKGRKVREEGEA